MPAMADDPHPDAVAMRLRIALQCNDCSELPPFGQPYGESWTNVEVRDARAHAGRWPRAPRTPRARRVARAGVH